MEIKGLENRIEIRMIYLDTMEEQYFQSIAKASRITNIGENRISKSLSPLLKKRFWHNNRVVIFRINKKSCE